MKVFALVVCVLALIAVSLAQVQNPTDPTYTGQPGCLTEEEVAVGVYPHFRVKRGYWRCSVVGQPATLELCPVAQGFLEAARACVPWSQWYWTPTVAPPSYPAADATDVPPQ
ncbi:uncharacterized protein [Musca autumnalis]|uniref:uncharacterized protein n=1 Tax=Musca autumnalis TaxID=221902 RepID=UPI003CE86AFD